MYPFKRKTERKKRKPLWTVTPGSVTTLPETDTTPIAKRRVAALSN